MITIVSLLLLSGCADAGKDQVVHVGDTVILDGNASQSKYGWTILKYKWKQIKGKHVELEDKNTSIATFIAPDIGKKKRKKLIFLLTTIEKSPWGTIKHFKDKTKVIVKSIVSTDKEAPVIALNGDLNITLYIGDEYTEEGATATDNVDGDVSVSISGEVDTNITGEYIITYNAQDKAGNKTSKIRTVTVKEVSQIALIFTGKAKSDFATSEDTITLEGYTYANDDIEEVTCLNKLTEIEETATGTDNWDLNITLQVGDNEIECTAILTDNETISKRTVTITYYENSTFTSLLDFEEDTFFVDETKVI